MPRAAPRNWAPILEWARRHNPTSRQLMKVVAQLAWGLEVVHRAEGLHRDVRGDNILVEPEGRAVLTDFGSCTWKGAPPLTKRAMPPNTREYQSPEALLFEWKSWGDKQARYEARAADDRYALAVSLYRLATGKYPPPGMDPETRDDTLRAPPPERVPIQTLNPRVVQVLVTLIERMLAVAPAARGRAREVAQAADSAAERTGPEADVPLFESEAVAAAVKADIPAGYSSRPRARQAALAAAATAFVAVTLCQGRHEPSEELPEVAQATAR